MEHVWAEGIHVMCVLPLFVPLFTLTICDALQAENSWAHHMWELGKTQQVQGKHTMSTTE